MKAAILSRAEQLHQLRRLIPPSQVPRFVRRRLDRLWAIPAFREGAEAQMAHLLEFTPRAAEAPALAYGYAEHAMLRSYLRWHPRTVTRQRVKDVHWLTERDRSRGLVINFVHHGAYEGMFAALVRHGAEFTIVMSPLIMGREPAIEYRQHRRIMTRVAPVIPAGVGTERLVDELQRGAALVIASDVPGRTPVTFLGRRGMGSSGAARTAVLSDSPVVQVLLRRDESGPYREVQPPIETRDFAGHEELLAELLRRHEGPVLDWPEALEVPRARFGPMEDDHRTA